MYSFVYLLPVVRMNCAEFIKMICNTMTHWVPIKDISEKYQIDQNCICNLIVRKAVASSKIGRKIRLIDEDSFISYLDMHKQIENKKEIIKELSDTDRMLEAELRACSETHAAFEVQHRVLCRFYRAFVQAFSLFIRNEEERDIFLLLSMGERLDLVASKYSHSIRTTLRIYKNTVERVSKKSFNFIEEQRTNVTRLEQLNRNMREVCIRLRSGKVRRRVIHDAELNEKEQEGTEVMRLTKQNKKLQYELSKERDMIKMLRFRLCDCEKEKEQKTEQIKEIQQQGQEQQQQREVELWLKQKQKHEERLWMEELTKEKFLLEVQLEQEKVRVNDMQMKLTDAESALVNWKRRYYKMWSKYQKYVAKVEADRFVPRMKHLIKNLRKWCKEYFILIILFIMLAVWTIVFLLSLF